MPQNPCLSHTLKTAEFGQEEPHLPNPWENLYSACLSQPVVKSCCGCVRKLPCAGGPHSALLLYTGQRRGQERHSKCGTPAARPRSGARRPRARPACTRVRVACPPRWAPRLASPPPGAAPARACAPATTTPKKLDAQTPENHLSIFLHGCLVQSAAGILRSRTHCTIVHGWCKGWVNGDAQGGVRWSAGHMQ